MKKIIILKALCFIFLLLFTAQAYPHEVIVKRMVKNKRYLLVCKETTKMHKKYSSPAVRTVYVVDANVFYLVKEGDILNILMLKKTLKKCRIYKLRLLE